jgi:hypothetical protein
MHTEPPHPGGDQPGAAGAASAAPCAGEHAIEGVGFPTGPAEDPAAGGAGSAWRCPEAKQLPELRGKLASWLAERGSGFYLEALLVGSQQLRPPGPLDSSASRLAEQERRRIADGELYWVSAEMTELAPHSGRQLSRYELYAHDLPSRSGFMVFQTPLATTDSDGIQVEIVAVSWGIIQPAELPLLARHHLLEVPVGGDWDQGAVWFTFYSHPQSVVDAALRRYGAGAEVAWPSDVGPFMPDNELLWALDQVAEPGGEDNTSAWGMTVVAAWLLMQQPLTAHSTQQPPRPARRRLQRAGLPTGDVRLLHVRRPQRRPTTHDDTGDNTDGSTGEGRTADSTRCAGGSAGTGAATTPVPAASASYAAGLTPTWQAPTTNPSKAPNASRSGTDDPRQTSPPATAAQRGVSQHLSPNGGILMSDPLIRWKQINPDTESHEALCDVAEVATTAHGCFGARHAPAGTCSTSPPQAGSPDQADTARSSAHIKRSTRPKKGTVGHERHGSKFLSPRPRGVFLRRPPTRDPGRPERFSHLA